MQSQNKIQYSLFNFCADENNFSPATTYNDFISKTLTIAETEKFTNYNLETYLHDLNHIGLAETWQNICSYLLKYGGTEFLQIKNFGELYEIGLAVADKQQKKDSGQYYTPEDVANVMSQWLLKQEAENVCDVACGTGKLILTYLELIGEEKAKQLIADGKLYLYDLDATAFYICKTIILLKYGLEFKDKIQTIHCNFLDANISLPKNCKVISNPPYSNFSQIKSSWGQTSVMQDTKELYAAFMKKIIAQSEKSVIITPYSFIGSTKFYSLRRKMCQHNGFIVCFDNVPGNIFCGRKHGIFNTNTSNSVRAAITVVENQDEKKGFRVSPLIRFKSTEREELLKCDVLEKFVAKDFQVVDTNNTMFCKCDSRLENIYTTWKNTASEKLCQLTSTLGEQTISMANTCRYFTAASDKIMNRGGQITLHFSNADVFNFVYCLINSSFVYWHWRLFDGGITYPKTLLLNMPTFFELLSADDKRFFAETATEMIARADEFIVTKNNVGVRENIKFPREYRDKINRRIFDILHITEDEKIMDIVHSNMALNVSV